jgi:hypothetical protein
LYVRPPYAAHSCRCENEIVLDRFTAELGRLVVPG